MNDMPLNMLDFEPEELRSVIADNVDLSALQSKDMRDIRWDLLDSLSPPSAADENAPAQKQ